MSDPQPGRPEAAAAIWTWQSEAAPRPSAAPIRRRGALQAAVGLAVAGGLFWAGRASWAAVVAAIATGIGLAALASPLALYAAIERGFAALGRGVGHSLTWLLLPAIFYGFFAPFSLLFRRGRRDALRRRFAPDAASYWSSRVERATRTASASHERPF
jgi:hypothetical protein